MSVPVPSVSGNLVSTELQVPPRQTINMQKIAALATRAGSMVEQIRGMLLAPEARKIPPTYSTAQLSALCRRRLLLVLLSALRLALPLLGRTALGGALIL